MAQQGDRKLPVVQWAAMTRRSIRQAWLDPKAVASEAQRAGHDAAIIADRGFTAALPIAMLEARAAGMPVIAGVWIGLQRENEPARLNEPPGDLLLAARSDDGLRRLQDTTGRYLGEHREEEAVIRAATDGEILALGATALGCRWLEEREALDAGLCVRTAPAEPGCEEAQVRAQCERTGRGAALSVPWRHERDESETRRMALAVLNAHARKSTWESEHRFAPAASHALTRDELEAWCADTPELGTNAQRLALQCRAQSAVERARMVRRQSTEQADIEALEESAREGLVERLRHATGPRPTSRRAPTGNASSMS